MNLFPHQRKMVERAVDRPKYLWAWDCGTGKTIGMLATIQSLGLKTVVVAPKTVALTAWANDSAHFPALRTVFLRAEDQGRERVIDRPWDVLVTNFEMFKKYAPRLLAAGARRLVVDESSKLKAHDTAITKAAIDFADKMDSVYLLSGTPAPNSWTNYWGQMRCVVGRAIPDFYTWCARCGYPVRERIRVKGQERTIVRRWEQTPEQAAAFRAAIGKYSWSLSKLDCMAWLPPQLDRIIDVPISEEEERAYTGAVEKLRIELRGGRVGHIKGAAALTKLRQIVGGAVYFDDESHALGGAKMEALGEICDELGPSTPCVVWFQYRHERERLARFFAERGERCEWLDGDPSGESANIVKRFQDGLTPRLLCHPQSVAHGVTLHRASHAVYYAMDFSWENFKQSRDRIHRAGMGDAPATYHVLRATLGGEKTVDHAMLKTVLGKKRDSDGILDALRDIGIDVAKEYLPDVQGTLEGGVG